MHGSDALRMRWHRYVSALACVGPRRYSDAMPATRIDDIDAVIAQARTEAGRRGLKVWPAFMTGKADVLFAYPHISVTDVFDVAVTTGAPFVTIDGLEFEEDEAFDGADMTAVLPDDLQRAVLARVGQTSSMTLWWRAGGTTYSYVAIASWEEDLSEKIQSWSEASRENTFAAVQNTIHRLHEIADFAAADERVKSAPHKLVVTAAEAVIRERFGDDIDDNTLSPSAHRAA